MSITLKKERLERVWRKINFKQITNFVERTPPPCLRREILNFSIYKNSIAESG